MAKYLTVQEVAAELAVTTERIGQLLREGRIEGARKHGRDWMIPSPVVRLAPEQKKGAGDD